MQIWQRGTSYTSPTYLTYTSDRWFVAGSATTSLSRSTDVPTGYQYSLSTTGTTSQAIGQRIESVNTQDLVGQSVTISFWLKQTTGAGAGAVGVSIYFPTVVDNYTTITQIGSTTNLTTTSSWAQYSVTFTSMPAGVANGLEMFALSTSSSSTTFLITGVQLEVGSVATPFERRQYGQELLLCQRYYEQLSSTGGFNAIGGAGVFTTTAQFRPYVTYQTKRASPTFTSSAASTFVAVCPAGNLAGSAISLGAANFFAAWLNLTVSGATAGQAGFSADNNTAAYLAFSAEL